MARIRIRVGGVKRPKAAAKAAGGALQRVGASLANAGRRVSANAPMTPPPRLSGIVPRPPVPLGGVGTGSTASAGRLGGGPPLASPGGPPGFKKGGAVKRGKGKK